MSFKNKLLSKSNSYTFYKENYESLLKENKSLKKKNKSLKKKNKKFKKQLDKKAKASLYDEFRQRYSARGVFCSKDYLDFYLDDDFEDNLKNVTQHLDSKNKEYYKYLILRSMFIYMLQMKTIYTEDEIKEQKRFREYKKNNVKGNKIGEFEFEGGYNIHPFVDLGLDDDCLEFLKNKDIIDAGAYTGDTSLPLSKITDKNVYAFEPFDESYDLLVKNIENNNISNIVPVKKSLGNIDGERTLYVGNNVQGITSQKDSKEWHEKFTVQESTVDKFVEDNDLDVGFIIIDVEGAETDLLNGAINTIKTQKPILTISIYHLMSDFFNIIPWVADLDLGYEFRIVKEGPGSFMADTCVQCVVRDNLK